MSNNGFLQITNRENCRSPIDDHLSWPTTPENDDLFFASGDTKFEEAVSFLRKILGEYILGNAAFFSETVIVPLVRELRSALQRIFNVKMNEYRAGLELDRGLSRDILEKYIQLTKSINLGCSRAKRSATLKRIFKLLYPHARECLKALQVDSDN